MDPSPHFLHRLARVSRPHLELALGLYRDRPVVRAVLDTAWLATPRDRAALALENSREGPYVIVTADARFVTCLGAGMGHGERTVVTLGTLHAVARRMPRPRVPGDLVLSVERCEPAVRAVCARMARDSDHLARALAGALTRWPTPWLTALQGLLMVARSDLAACRDDALWLQRVRALKVLLRAREKRAVGSKGG